MTKETQPDLPWSRGDRAQLRSIRETSKPFRPRPVQAAPTPAPMGSTVHTILRYPDVVVAVPRAVAAAYGDRTWAEVLAAAASGTDGLAVLVERPRIWRGFACEPPPNPPDVAFLAEGEDNWRGRPVLYQQNW